MKKFLSILLLLAMILTLFPGMAFAAEGEPEAEDTVIEQQADAAAAEEPQPAEDAAVEAAAAAEPEPAAEQAEDVQPTASAASTGSNVKSVLFAGFYVAPNAAAGLDGKVSVQFAALGSVATLYLPGKADVSQLCFSWDDAGIKVTKDGVAYESGAAPVAAPGKSVTYKVTKGAALAYVTVKTVQGAKDVEPMFLNLDESLGTIAAMNGDGDHETSCYGTAQFDGVDKAVSIKGRGNSTWDFPKKPYNITFYKKTDYEKKDKTELIPGVKAKKWSLLANYLDNSLLRNKVAMDLASEMGIGLPSRFVDVWMNGEYLGNYLLTPKKDALDKFAPDGGFMLDNDHIPQDVDQFEIQGMHDMLLKHNRINIEDIGDDAVAAGVDQAYIEAYFNEAFAALTDYGTENYQNYFDIDSWAKMFLMVEVSKTYDCYAGNFLMHRDGLTPDDKLIAGPAWDYDIAFGRTLHKFLVGVSEPVQLNAEGWYNDSIGLFAVDKPVSLLQELGKHASFMREVAKVYNEYRYAFEDIAANVDRQREILRDSAAMNNVLWGTNSLCADYLVAPNTMRLLGTGKYALNYEVTLTWDNYVNNLREFASKRVLWLSDHLTAAAAPEGSIVEQVLSDGSAMLQVVLTAGNDKNTYQWQVSAADGWINVEGETEAICHVPAGSDALYRCVVNNAGAVIVTTHGGSVPTYTQSVIGPEKVSGRVSAVRAENYPDVSYSCYTYLGDSISFGYGLDNSDNHDPYSLGLRVRGSFPDLVAGVLEENGETVVHPAASSGSRLCDYRILLERGMGVENPYDRVNDWYGNRHPERTEVLRNSGEQICQWVREADLITLQVGINDLTGALVNALCATGLIDLDQIGSISDLDSLAAYLRTAAGNLAKDPDVLGNLTRTFNSEISEIRTNAREVVKDVTQLAPEADILVIGYHKAVQGFRVIPDSDFSPIFDLIDAALVSLNDYYLEIAGGYSNVYYVDAPDASVFFPAGTTLVDALKNTDKILWGIHPDAAGHAYIATRVLDELEQLQVCPHKHTQTSSQTVKLPFGTEIVGAKVCTDCGKVLDSGAVHTPAGSVNVPSLTIQNAVVTVTKNVAAVFDKIIGFGRKLFG